MGLLASIYRVSGTGSVAARYGAPVITHFGGLHAVTIVNLDGPFEPSEQAPAALVIDGHLPGTHRVVGATGTDHFWTPVKLDGYLGPIGNGAFVYTSDGRFKFDAPISLHDRYEKHEIAEALSQ